ncbi:hypothetical protein C8R48DRAFT_671733 [Suillus tomentosus]|nr:hypothetical protein C8R48DRAFT_671733 [Suillus tomentosus]
MIDEAEEWMKISCNTPSLVIFVWDQAGKQVQVHGHVIIVEQYKAILHNTLRDTIAFFYEKVLRGTEVSPATFTLPTYDNYDQKTHSHGLFPLSLETSKVVEQRRHFGNMGTPRKLTGTYFYPGPSTPWLRSEIMTKEELLAAFLWVFRPIELLLTLTSEAWTEERKAEVASLYQMRRGERGRKGEVG